MTDDDLIRRGDALYAIAGWEIPSTAIAALPAVTQPAPDAAAIREAALQEAADKFSRLATLRKMWTVAEVENVILALLTEKPHDRA